MGSGPAPTLGYPALCLNLVPRADVTLLSSAFDPLGLSDLGPRFSPLVGSPVPQGLGPLFGSCSLTPVAR